MRKRIVFITTTNAVPQRTLLISRLLEADNDVLHICWRRSSVSNLEKEEMHLIDAGSCTSFAIKAVRMLLRRNFDCAVFSDFRLFPFVLLLCKAKRTKILYDRQEVPTVTAAERINKMTGINFDHAFSLAERLENLFCNHSDGVLIISLSNEMEVKISSVNNNTAVVLNTPDTSVQAKPYEIPEIEGKNLIIYSGGISEEMGLKQYLRLIKNIRTRTDENVHLLLIGHLWELDESKLKKIIQAEECTEYVTYKKWIPYENLLYVLSQAKLGLALFDNSHEKFKHMLNGSSRKIFTYMACGIPVITNPPLGDFVFNEGCGVLVDYKNEDEFYRRTIELLMDDETRRKMGQRGKDAIFSKYNWQKESRKVKVVFENMWRQ
jgi:glycosyltransferase involved in cell wall biosynthesis